MKIIRQVLALVLTCAAPAFAGVLGGVGVSSPANGSQVTSPFQLAAGASTCGASTVVSMGYSLDSSSSTTVVAARSISASVPASLGPHVLHVKSWGKGTACVANVSITVVAAPTLSRGDVKVSVPAPNAQVTPQFPLAASDAVCSSTAVTAMGYSLDSQPNAFVVNGQAIKATVSSTPGSHVLHVKSWGPGGAACVTNVPVNVKADPAVAAPSNALVFHGIAQDTNWKASHDTATGSGTTYGDMYTVGSPSLSGNARQFTTTFYQSTGERYSTTFGSDTFTHDFLYDGWVYIKSPNGGLANLELDINQVIGNGDTIILAFQCDGYSGTWDYGENAGTVQHTKARWIHSAQKCNPREWATNTWHHVQIRDTRNDNGTVTYHAVWLDGVEQDIEQTVPGDFSLGWGSVVQTNFQVDGLGASGSVTLYLDNLTVYAW